MILALVTSAETAPPLATAQTTVVDCAYDDRRLRRRRSSTAQTKIVDCACDGRRLRLRKMQEWEGGGVWDDGLEEAADGHENSLQNFTFYLHYSASLRLCVKRSKK